MLFRKLATIIGRNFIFAKGNQSLISSGLRHLRSEMGTISDSNIVWVDLEMTGLDHTKDTIVEVACIVTDKNLNIVAEGPNLVIHHSLESLNAMDDWCIKTFTKNGLFKQSLDSSLSLIQAENQLLEFVQKYTVKGKPPLAGNSVGIDKMFLLKDMSRFADHLHYRMLDVTSVKLISKFWFDHSAPAKKLNHRALDDIKESIAELAYYRNTLFKTNPLNTTK